MRIRLLLAFVLSAIVSLAAQKETDKPDYCDLKNTTLSKIGESSPIFAYIVENKGTGAIAFKPFLLSEIGGWETFVSSLHSDPNITFEFVGMTKSLFSDDVYYRYQQYYDGLPVVGGGFSITLESDDTNESISPPCEGCPGPVDPCNRISYMFADIFEGMNIGTFAVEGLSTLPNSLLSQFLHSSQTIENSTLNVRPLLEDCTYTLAWEIDYRDEIEGDMVRWLDAQTGDVLYQTTRHNFKNAPTADYEIRFLNDEVDGNQTFLRNEWVEVQVMFPQKTGQRITQR